MQLPSKAAYKVLAEKGVEHLHHANSVITSCQFLRAGRLISRGNIARNGMFQTPQSSDKDDQNFGVWFDVFADSVDIHARARTANAYGPVLFVLDAKIIDEAYTGPIWVTKTNPIKWKGRSHEERWFTSIQDLKDNFVMGCFDQMIVFRHCGGALPIKKYLKEIILDDPALKFTKSGVNHYSMAYGALRLAMTDGRMDIPISRRECSRGCKCRDIYVGDAERTRTMYIPKL